MEEIVVAKNYNISRLPIVSVPQDAADSTAKKESDIKKDSKNIDKDASQTSKSGMQQLSVEKLVHEDKLSESAASKTSEVIEKMMIQHRQERDLILETVVEDKEKSSSSRH